MKSKKFKLTEGSKEKLSELKDFLKIIIGYGILINFMLWALFRFRLNIFSLFAWGILYYFISEELVKIIRRIKSR